MKFYFIAVVISILIAGTVCAQHINVGVKGGLNLYNINDDNGVNYDTKAGIHLGLLGHIHLAKQLALQPELVYSAQGAKYNARSAETKYNLGYINVPVLIQYMFDNGFRLQAGPQVGFLISAKADTNGNSADIKHDFEAVDFALGIGAGYVNPGTGLGIDARYNLGLSNINKSSSAESTNRGFQLGVFYLFGHK